MAGGAAAAASSSWKPLLLKALDANSHLKHSSFFQLVHLLPPPPWLLSLERDFNIFVLFQATIGSNGKPANRTVVFRGFQENCDKIQINTDGRSSKIEEIKRCPFGEICWYFTDSWEQFRINGRIDIVDGSNPDPLKLQVDYLNLKSNERLLFTSRPSGSDCKVWMFQKTNP